MPRITSLGTGGASGGSGTVTNAALAMPAEWGVSGSPITAGGTFTVTRPTLNATAKTTTYPMTTADYHILVNPASSFTVTMPDPTTCAGQIFVITYIAASSMSNVVTIAAFASEKFGAANYTSLHLSTKDECWELQSDGTNWRIRGHATGTQLVDYTPTIGAITTAPTFNSGATLLGSWGRQGQFMYLRGYITQTSATSTAAGTGAYLWPLPVEGWTIDTSHLVATASPTNANTSEGLVGTGVSYNSADQLRSLWTQVRGSTQLFGSLSSNATWSSTATTGHPATSTTIHFGFEARIPITNWEP